jgi:hypothetical protein
MTDVWNGEMLGYEEDPGGGSEVSSEQGGREQSTSILEMHKKTKVERWS